MLFLFIVKNKKWKGNESCHTHECGNKVSKGQKNKRERWNIIGQRATAAYWVHNEACCTFSKWCQNIYIYSQHLAIQHLLTFLCTFYMDLALTEWQYVWWEAASYFLSLSQMSPWGSFRNYDCGTFTSPRSPSLNPIWKLFSVFSVNAAHAIKEIKSNFSSQCWHLQNNKWEESVIHCTTQHYVRRLVNLYVNKHRVIYPC